MDKLEEEKKKEEEEVKEKEEKKEKEEMKKEEEKEVKEKRKAAICSKVSPSGSRSPFEQLTNSPTHQLTTHHHHHSKISNINFFGAQLFRNQEKRWPP